MIAELAERLRAVPALQNLAEEQLLWFAEHSEVVRLSPGDALFSEGDPAEWMFVVLQGEFHARKETGASDGRLYIRRVGEVAGMLPFSRLTHFPVTGRAVLPSEILRFPKALFPEMLRRIPELEQRLVQTMADRVRESTQRDQQREKLISLGRLSAGLAHELNNPAAAALRASNELHRAISELTRRTAAISAQLGADMLARLETVRKTLNPATAASLSPLARSDRDEEIAQRLQAYGAPDSWRSAPTLTAAGADPPWLNRFVAEMPSDSIPAALEWLEATLSVEALVSTVEHASARIADLVGAVKSYTYMDQALQQDVDVHAGLETTLQVLGHKLRNRILVREYASQLPQIFAVGGELNQVWTNLLDNAADAAGPGGRIIIRTACEKDAVSVEIIDNGPGVPREMLDKIFEPFFTTKEVGRGSGLGLDIARRIVEAHHGSIRVTSVPGEARFIVTLPVTSPKRD